MSSSSSFSRSRPFFKHIINSSSSSSRWTSFITSPSFATTVTARTLRTPERLTPSGESGGGFVTRTTTTTTAALAPPPPPA